MAITSTSPAADVRAYFALLPAPSRQQLKQLREAILSVAPRAEVNATSAVR